MRHLIAILFLLLPLAPLAQAEIFNLDDEELTPVVSQPVPKVVPKPVPKVVPKAEPTAPTSPQPPVAPVSVPPSVGPAPQPEPPVVPVAPVVPPPVDNAPPPPQFLPYREARAAFLKRDYKTAFIHFNRVVAMDRAQNQKEGKPNESVFASAARLGREQCRLAAGDAKDKARALANLRKFCEDDISSLYRGEALLILAQERMQANDSAGALPWLVKAEQWIKAARDVKAESAWADIPENLRPQLTPEKSLWQEEADFFGNPVRRPLAPEWVVNERTSPQYFDELEIRWAKMMGFAAMVRGDAARTKACWQRAAQLEPAVLPLSFKGKSGDKSNPTDAVRLEFAAQNGRMLAYPGEEYLLNSQPKAKERVLYAEFLYLTQEFDMAEQELREVLAADDAVKAVVVRQKQAFEQAAKKAKGGLFVPKFRAAGLSDAQRDYVQITLGTVLNRKGDSAGALGCLEAVFSQMGHTQTERRAVLAYLNGARLEGSAAQRKRADELEAALLASKVHDVWGCLARIWKVRQLEKAGRHREVPILLAWYKPEDGVFYDIARKQLAMLNRAKERK